MPIGLLNKLIFGAKRIAFYLKEKPTFTIDDHVLEHLLFYHGLTGSSPHNNKETKIVAADIKESLERKNSAELALALKLPPTLWEERLKDIITNLGPVEQELLINLLLQTDTEIGARSETRNMHFPLDSEDWQVRANTANIVAFLDAKKAVGPLVKSLTSDISGNIMSFCYVAYALGKLQGNQAKEALVLQLANSDAWLRVDAAGALSFFHFDSVSQPLSSALLEEQESLDYLAYAISRKHKPIEFLRSSLPRTIKAGGQLITGIMEAAQNSFSSALMTETESDLCLLKLIELAQRDADPIVVNTTLHLCDWLIAEKDTGDLQIQKEIISKIVNDDNFKKNILDILSTRRNDFSTLVSADLTHAIQLAGRLDLGEAQPLLISLLTTSGLQLGYAQLKNIIIALGQISTNSDSSTAYLVKYAGELFDIEERCQLPKSKQPIAEENTAEAKIYWQILKTLGDLPTATSVSFLFQTLNDYAPDKRACALESLMANYKKDAEIKLPKSTDQILQEALRDCASMMQLAALNSIALINTVNLIDDMVPLIDAHENTVSKHALASFALLAKNGHAEKVNIVLNEKLKTIREEHKKRRILDILQNQY